ncbi:MAG TPA: anaerobic glycerol-3-phosphate dehydrogenase subunit C, partial [Aggregatilineales bacterium]|nr:anaerobic glycerol-3-phosphate dehydrogenase subunit C [Aggregatilineales bacterium]
MLELHEQPYTPHLPYLEETPFSADHCLKCNICTQACPVAAVTPLFPGPKTVGPQAQRFRNGDLPSVDNSLDYCSSCGICTLVCPHGVRVMEINTQAKAHLAEAQPFGVKKFRNWILGRNAWWGLLGTPFAALLNWLFTFKPFRWALEKTIGVSQRAAFPKWAGYTFRGWWRRRERAAKSTPITAPTVVYYHGCSTNTYEPHIGKLAVQILEKNGFRVIVPEQACCGLPMQSNGDFPAARRFAAKNTEALAGYVRQGIPIVGTSASCIMALKGDYQHVLGMDDEDTRTLAGGIYDMSEFLYRLHGEGKLNTAFRPVGDFSPDLRAMAAERRVPYHAPCQLKAHGMGRPALDLLDLIPGMNTLEMDAECCGVAGTYAYKVEKRQIAEDVGAPLFNRIKELGAPLAIC